MAKKITPDWLARLTRADIERGEIPLNHVLDGSAYCAGVGLAETPVEIVAGNVVSFVYADHRVVKVEFEEKILRGQGGFAGYDVKAHADVTRQIQQRLDRVIDFAALGIVLTERERINHEIEFVKRSWEPFARWVVLERRGSVASDRISLLFVAHDPVAAFLGLYRARDFAPEVLCVDRFSGNWTDLHDPAAALGQAVRHNPAGSPRFLALIDTGSGHLIRTGPTAWGYRDERFLAPDQRAGVWARTGYDVGPKISRDNESRRVDR